MSATHSKSVDYKSGDKSPAHRRHTLPHASPQSNISPTKVYSGPTLVAANMQSTPVNAQLDLPSDDSADFTIGNPSITRSASHPASSMKQINQLSLPNPSATLPVQFTNKRYSTPIEKSVCSDDRKKLHPLKEDTTFVGKALYSETSIITDTLESALILIKVSFTSVHMYNM